MKRWVPGLILLASLAIALACVAYPIYVIRPFRAQGAAELEAALLVTRFRPVVSIVAALVAMTAASWQWRATQRWPGRLMAAAGALLVCGLAFAARVNIYERMFHPIGRASFLSLRETKLDGDEKVVSVKIGRSARAYPIRSISYHHIVNDVVEKQAIVATY